MSDPGPQTIADVIALRFRHAPDTYAALDENGIELTYRALADEVLALAGQISAAIVPAARRPRIAIILPNGLGLTVALLAVSVAGEAAPLNPALTAAELGRYFDLMQVSALLVAQDDTGEAVRLAQDMGIAVLRLSLDRRIQGAALTGAFSPPRPDDIAMVLLTSGSTGVPKIVPLSHRNVCRSARDVAQSVALSPQDRCLVMWQQFHIGGLVDLLLAPLLAGGTLIVTRRFDATLFFDLLETVKPTWFQGVPTTLGALVVHADRHAIVPRGSSLRFIRSVAAALTPSLQAEIGALFGVPVVRTLGMTEASPLITSTELPPAIDKPGSVGRPCGPEVRVFGPDMQVLPNGQAGEIAIRGVNVFAGYENNPEANELAFRDGWFFTGDNGHLDADGYLFLTGRTKEQINRGGYKIMPPEVEEALSRHPAVHEAAVLGVAHPTLGEDVAAAVGLKDGAAVTAETLRAHLSGILAVHKVPGRIMILPNLPRNPVGKIDRLQLAQMALADSGTVTAEDAPRTTLERFLVQLWSRELALDDVGIHQDFVSIGGDSLSALRIVMSMQEVFGRPVADDLVAEARTIAQAAEMLAAAGFMMSADQERDIAGTAARALDATTVGTEDMHGNGGIAEALRVARNKSDVEAAFEGLKVYDTPATIVAVLGGLARTNAAVDVLAPFRQLLQRKVRLEIESLTAEIAAGGKSALAWQRKDAGPCAIRFGDPDQPAAGKTLIVGFTGKLLRLQLPSYRFLLRLDPARYDLLLLRDTSQRLFAAGLPDMGESIMALGQWLNRFAASEGYCRRIAIGTSGGGLAALHTGVAFGWDRAIASSPPSPQVNEELGRCLAALAADRNTDRPEIVITHSGNTRDTPPAEELVRLFPGARHDLRKEFTSHNVLESAHRAGKLDQLFSQWFD